MNEIPKSFMADFNISVVPRTVAVKSSRSQNEPLHLPFVNLDELKNLPSIRACYFVLDNDKILYIGRTENLKKRWVSHHIMRNHDLPDSIKIAWYEALPFWSLEKMERSLIKDYRPKINVPCKNENTVRLTVDVSQVTHLAFKQACIKQGVTMTEKMSSLMEDWLKTNP